MPFRGRGGVAASGRHFADLFVSDYLPPYCREGFLQTGEGSSISVQVQLAHSLFGQLQFWIGMGSGVESGSGLEIHEAGGATMIANAAENGCKLGAS